MSVRVPEGRRAQNKAQNRAAILDAARAVFAERSYDAAGVRDIIRRTGLASGTFYNYFEDKEAVFRAVVEDTAAELRVRLQAVRAGAPNSQAFIGDAYRELFAFLVEDALMFQLLQRNAGPLRSLFGDPVLAAGVEDLVQDLQGAMDRGDLPAVDVEYLAGAMAGVALEVGVRMAERTPPDVERAARFATELFLGGIARLGESSCQDESGRGCPPSAATTA